VYFCPEWGGTTASGMGHRPMKTIIWFAFLKIAANMVESFPYDLLHKFGSVSV